MNKLEVLKQNLASANKFNLSNYVFTHAVGDDVLEVPKEDVPALLLHLRESGMFDFLMDICGADYPNRERRFDVVYNLFSSKDASRLRIKAQVGENETIGTALQAWRGADWFEREAYDMYGIIFEGHPNLRKI
ncbi:MAG: NADH-quinone oxidoreductase subunit C, partial [Bdellovibrio sp.]